VPDFDARSVPRASSVLDQGEPLPRKEQASQSRLMNDDQLRFHFDVSLIIPSLCALIPL